MSLRNMQFPLNYSDVSGIFGSVAPITIDHNNADGGEAIFNQIQNYYGSEMFTQDGAQSNWTRGESETNDALYRKIGSQFQFEDGTFSAYFIN